MAQINYGDKTISCKIVYYGPGLSGKTTNLQEIFGKTPGQNKGKMVSLATEGDRTLYFDFLPLDLGEIKGFKTKFQLYTVPGQIYYNATRKLVLKGVDGVVFIADSSAAKMEENKESLQNLFDNLAEINLTVVKDIPFVIQYNKRDLPDALPVEELRKELNTFNVPDYEAVAFKAVGIFKTLKAVAKLFIESFHRKYGFEVNILDAETDAFDSKSDKKDEVIEESVKSKPETVSELIEMENSSTKEGTKDKDNTKQDSEPAKAQAPTSIDIDFGNSGDSSKKTPKTEKIEEIEKDNLHKPASIDRNKSPLENIEIENHREENNTKIDDLVIEDIDIENSRFSDDTKKDSSELEISDIGLENFSNNDKHNDKSSIKQDQNMESATETANGEDDFESDVSKLKSELTDNKSNEIKPPPTTVRQESHETKQTPSFKQTPRKPGSVNTSKSGTMMFAKKKKKSLFGKVFSMLSNKGD